MRLRWVAGGVFAGMLSSAAVVCAQEGSAYGTVVDDAARIQAIGQMLDGMRAESRLASERIRAAYGRELSNALSTREALIASLESGDLRRLPLNPAFFNLDLRLAGDHPIAERDLVYQPIYVAARPATLGALFAVGRRVRSGPVEVTSLVRHHDYQRALRRSNANAATTVPTHTMGLAFDISLLNSSLETAHEIRDVLRAMSDAGELFVIAETHQLVFHVVPAPAAHDAFDALYYSLMMLLPDDLHQPVVVADAMS